MEWEELRLANGRGGVRSRGFLRLAYRDPVDDSPQFCRVYLPTGYTPAKRWPLVVNLHGYNPDNTEYVRWGGMDNRHNSQADTLGIIEVEPMGRYNTGYQGIGEKDVMRCVELAKRQLSVDNSRTYLTGGSINTTVHKNLGNRKDGAAIDASQF